MPRGEEEATKLERAVDTFIERVQRVPERLRTVPPAEGEWTVMELAAHSAEIYPYWAKQITFLRVSPGVPFGRTASDPDRIRFVDEHKSDSLKSLIDRLRTGSREASAALRAFTDQDWSRVTGIHAARGEMTMDA
ncbi:MAG TPA: DinB family protein, partial [Chloroflexota bacterium]